MANNWFLGRNGHRVGPLTIYQLKQLAAMNMVQPEDHLLQEGTIQWVPAASLTWLTFTPVNHQYRVIVSGKSHGPYTVVQIRAALLSGRIPPETLACADDTEQWTQVQQMTEFQSSLPTILDTPKVPKRVSTRTMGMNQEEAELYLAGKRGDSLAKLISSLLHIKRKHADNPPLLEIIDANIQSLRNIRSNGTVLVG